MKLLEKIGWATLGWIGIIVTCYLYYIAIAGIYIGFFK